MVARILTATVVAAVAAGAALGMPDHSKGRNPEFHHPVSATGTIVFTGTVTAGGKQLSGASVRVMPWGAAGVTDGSGVYSIPVPDAKLGDAAIIRIQSSGFGEVSRTVTVAAETVRTDIELSESEGRVDPPVLTEPPRQRRLQDSMREMAAQAMAAPLPATPTCCDHLRHADPRDYDTEGYAAIDENPFLGARANPVSTFSIDVDRASYANVRRFINEGRLPPIDAVRIEELVNYFSYGDPAPENGAPFAVTTEFAPAPWKAGHRLLRIALKAKSIDTDNLPASNLVFLIDVSGSMQSPDKLPLLKQAFGLLVNELRPEDRVAMVVYAGAAGLVLESTSGGDKERILEAIEELEAGGSTAGGEGIRLAYDVARRNHIDGGNNRVILATDGDFNVGASSDAEMMRLIEEKRSQGTFLTVLGFGTGNIKDSKMEILADRGNGNYAYIDGLMEARKVLIEEMGGTLFAVAKDVKLQVEFNPARVRGYRLIGYENRLLAAEDFNDDRKDAGELGAGHSVTALYEIVPMNARTDVEIRGVDSLRYQSSARATRTGDSDELGFVKLRWKKPAGETSTLMEHTVDDRIAEPSPDFMFAAAVASFGMILRDSPHSGQTDWDRVLAWAREGLGADEGGYRAGFIELIERASRLETPVAAGEGPHVR
jgi:Ca-activated chloride channel family protein